MPCNNLTDEHGIAIEAHDQSSPIMLMFETFRSELDEHHDRRERVIKASRDITAAISSLCRVRTLKGDLPPQIMSDISARYKAIDNLFSSIVPDLASVNAWRYQRQISPGIQEFVEAISFEHYLRYQRLITLKEAALRLHEGIVLTDNDYVLGLFDLIGELMRFAITGMATLGTMPGSLDVSGVARDGEPEGEDRNIIVDLRGMRACFESLNTSTGDGFAREVDKKMAVMRTSVEKVEKAVYGMIVRGSERPKGWMPDAGAGGGGAAEREVVESY